MKTIFPVLSVFALFIVSSAAAVSAQPSLNGAGATFPTPSIRNGPTNTTRYRNPDQLPVHRLRRGHRPDQAKTVDFGASDAPSKKQNSTPRASCSSPLSWAAWCPW